MVSTYFALVDTILAASARGFKASWPDAYDDSLRHPPKRLIASEAKLCNRHVDGGAVVRNHHRHEVTVGVS